MDNYFCLLKTNVLPRGVFSFYEGFTNCHLYHYAGNNPIVYTDPDGRDAKNNTPGYIVIRLEDYVPVTINGETYMIHNMILRPGDYAIGKFDGAMDEYGNIIKVSAWQFLREKVNFSVETLFDHIYLNITDNKSKNINKRNDIIKIVMNIFLLQKNEYDLSGNYTEQKREGKTLFSWWKLATRGTNEPGSPDKWKINYYSKEQVELRRIMGVTNENDIF